MKLAWEKSDVGVYGLFKGWGTVNNGAYWRLKGCGVVSVPPLQYFLVCRRNNNMIHMRFMNTCWIGLPHW